MKLKLTLILSASCVALATGAVAQTGSNQALPPPAADQAPASTPPASPGTTTPLSEIVVTANRRAENLQNVPITVSAVNATQLAASGVTNVQDIQSIVPGANVINANGAINSHLRGVGNSNPGPGIEPAVALYIDGVYYASTLGVDLDLGDAQEVEVLKGPQGTLFGRNATGGLIQITTRDPTHSPTLDLEAGYGDYDTSKVNIYAAGGLANNLVANVSVQASHQGDGYGTNLFNDKPVYYVDLDVQSRSKIIWTPFAQTKFTAVFDYSDIREDIPFRLEPGSTPASFTGPAYGGTVWDTDNDQPTNLSIQTGGASLKAEQELPFMRLSDIVAYRETAAHQGFDIDATATPYQSTDVRTNERQFTEELQAQSIKGSWLTWTAGVYYFDDIGQAGPADVTFDTPLPGPLDPLFPFKAVLITARQDTSSIAGYGQASAEILPATHLTLGARYTSEDHKLVGGETLLSNLLPPIGVGSADERKDFGKSTYRVALDHRFSKELLAYVSYNTGFKSGGYNSLAPVLAPPVPGTPASPFLPESLTAYEAGVKSDLFGNRVRANLSAFYYDYRNIQVQQIAPSGISTIVANAPGAHVSGVDFDLTGKVTEDLTVRGGMEYLHDRFTTFPAAPISSSSGGTPETTGPASGNRLPLAPDAVVDLGGEYDFRQVVGGDAVLSLAYVYSTGYYLEVDNFQHQSPFSELNGSLRWRSSDRAYSASLWANNITNSAISVFGVTQVYGNHEDNYAPPRTFGFTVGYHF